MWYNKAIVGFFRQEGGERMNYLISFVVTIMARIVGYFVCKWLDSHRTSDK